MKKPGFCRVFSFVSPIFENAVDFAAMGCYNGCDKTVETREKTDG